MIRRYGRRLRAAWGDLGRKPGLALRGRWREGYGAGDLRSDLMAGLVVSLVAVPLAMALAIAVGVPPQHGLYTAGVAGVLVALLGGSRFQVTGPTAAFVVILSPIVSQHGVGGLLLAGLMAGAILVVLGLAGLGAVIQFVPHPVTAGFTAGIGLVIAVLQLKDFAGLSTGPLPDHFLDRVAALLHAAPTWSPAETALGLGTLGFLVVWPRVSRRIPAPLAALALAGGAAWALEQVVPGLSFATIEGRFHYMEGGSLLEGIPRSLPGFAWPWAWGGPGGSPLAVDFDLFRALLPPALAIALLGAIESLLSAVVADGITRTRHDPDAELLALGIGNLACPFLGGIPATGAIARTATNIRSGARSPLAAVFHGVLVLAALVLFAPLFGKLPMAALSALLLLVAYHMSELRHVRFILNVAPRSDVLVFLVSFGLTVFVDMVLGVGVGVVLAALLFMRRMANATHGRALHEFSGAESRPVLPPGTVLYEISGPLFFGAVDNAIDALQQVDRRVRHVVFLLDQVPVMDVSALVALESAVRALVRGGRSAVLVGARVQPLALLKRSSLLAEGSPLAVHHPRLDDALRDLAAREAR